jgi:hypothetical protein
LNDEDREFAAVDRLIETYLDRQVEQVDAGPLIARIGKQDSVNASTVVERAPERPATGRWPRALIWASVTGAAVVAAFFGGRYATPPAVDAAMILRDVQAAYLQQGVDRCYRVLFAPDPEYWDKSNQLTGPSESVMWTRGDRFWSQASIGTIQVVFGRDEHGTFWVTPFPSRGIVFAEDASQMPDEVALHCVINSMNVSTLLDDVLADFDLQAQPSPGDDQETAVIWARLKPERSHALLSAAMIEVDTQTDTIVRLVLWTKKDGRPKGSVSYTLLESGAQDDNRYRLKSHIDADADIQTHRFE